MVKKNEPWTLQFISVIFAWVVLMFGSSLLRFNMHYFVIYAHISPIMLGFDLYGI